MLTSIIFSKNRACQLDLLLRSMKQNLPNFNQIFILYHATTPEFEVGYSLLKYKFNNCVFIQQAMFQQDTLELLNAISINSKYVCFFVDDNIIYRSSDIDYEFIDKVFSIPDLTCFSMRLGTNTIIQDQYSNQYAIFPENFLVGSINGVNVLLWNWKSITDCGNFGYPFSVDGHIYKTEDLIPLLDYEFDTPNAFEGRFDKTKFTTNIMACLENSILVNNPLNIVGSSNNNAGWWYGHTLEKLNEKYLDNHQISLNSIMKRKIVAAHQEMEIEYESW